MFISKSKFYTFSLLILPMLIAVSWLNVFAGNANYEVNNYLLTFVLPAAIATYVVTLIAAEYLNEQYHFTLARFLFTFTILVVALAMFALVNRTMGNDITFITANIHSISEYEIASKTSINAVKLIDPREVGSKIYSFQLMMAMVTLVIFYSIAVSILKEKVRPSRRERVIVNLKKAAKKHPKTKKK